LARLSSSLDSTVQAHRSSSISSSRLRTFALKLVLYSLPFALPFLLLTGFLVYTGESMPLSMVVALQNGGDPVLYRPRYGNRDLQFKLFTTNTRQPEVIALGSSHILQFRAMFLNRDSRSFYNAGGPAWQLSHIEAFLDGLTYTPRILILSLDHPWFNDAYPGDPFAPSLEPTSDFDQIFMVNRSVLQTLIDGESLDLSRMLERREPGYGGLALGLRAIRDGHGFRSDGSEQYGDFLIAHFLYPENERARHLSLLQNGEDMYVRGDTVSETGLSQLDILLQECEERGITIIGFLPPFMPTLYQQMIDGGQHGYVQRLPSRLQALFQQHRGSFFDFTDSRTLGAVDTDFFDGWHASERIYLRLYGQMLQALPELLGTYSDRPFLEAADANATDTFNVFGSG
jgi:hypothetical protein